MRKLLLAFAAIAAVLGAKAELPAGYTALPYISSTDGGKQWINTRYLPSCTDKFELKVVFHKKATQSFFCSRTGSKTSDQTFTCFYVSNDSGYKIRFDRKSTSNLVYSKDIVETGVPHEIVVDGSTCKCTLDGVQTATMNSGNDFELTSMLTVFAGHSSKVTGTTTTSGVNNFTFCSMYYFKVTDKDGNVQVDLTPCKNSDGTIGMYDCQRGMFFSSQGDEEFACADDKDKKQIYELKASTSAGVDLMALEGYYADRMYGPSSADVNFSGPLTVDPDISAENPFALLGRGKKITVNAANSGLHALPLKLCNAEGRVGASTLAFSAGAVYSGKSLDVGRYNTLSFNYYSDGNVTLATELFDIHDGGKLSGFGLALGRNKNVHATVCDDGSVSGSYYVQLGSQTTGTDSPLTAFMEITNATVTAGGTDTSNGKCFTMMFNCAAPSDETVNCQVFLRTGGLLTANTISHHGGGCSRIYFDGGRYKSDNTKQTQPLFHAYGHTCLGDWTNPQVTLEGVNGHPVDVEVAYDRVFASAPEGSRKVNLVGAGGFTKRGAGALTFNRLSSSSCTYTGPTSILGGGLIVDSAVFKPGRGALNVSESSFLDLNGFDCEFATATGAGVITNGADAVATLTLGYGDASGDFELGTIGGPVNVAKTGTGTLTVRKEALANVGDLTVLAGTVVFAGDSTSYGTVTVEQDATLDIRGISFSCKKLVNKGKVLADNATKLVLGGDEDQVFNNGLVGLTGDFVKEGVGTLELFGAETIGGLVDVKAGTLKVQSGKWTGKYFKLNLQKAQSTDDNQWHKRLGTFALYDAQGHDVAQAITVQNSTKGDTGAELAEGEVRLGNVGWYDIPDGYGVLNLFDGKNNTQFDLRSSWGSEFIILRLPDETGDVVGYNFNTGMYESMRLVTWNLYGSQDGNTWTLLDNHLCADWNDMDERAKTTNETPDASVAWYNDGVPYSFKSYSGSGRTFGETAVARVSDGATLDLGSVSMELGGLLVDCEAGGGSILRFTPSENGVLDLMNADLKQLHLGYVLPMTFGEIAQPQRLKTWAVKVNGVINDRLKIYREADGNVKVAPRGGLILIFR